MPVTSDDLLNRMNESVAALQAAQKTVVQAAEKMGNAVHLTGAETISGKKTFTQGPDVPDAADNDNSKQAANTGFVQRAIGSESKNTVHTSGNESISGIKTFATPPVLPVPTDKAPTSMQGAPVSWVRDMLRAEVEAMSSGRNTVVRDKNGNPHIMVRISAYNLQDIDASLGTGLHPAFIVNGVKKSEILIGKFVASKGSDGLAQTLPGKFPWVNINFDDSIAAARALGNGFGLCTNAAYAARSLWLWKQFGEHEYLGNTNYGRSHSKPWQTGKMEYTDMAPGDTGAWNAGKKSYTLTGSGPVEWNDDETPCGISDLVGNVWEWAPGIRLNNGEIQVIANNDALLSNISHAANSASWKAIKKDGSLVAPGTADTLKYDAAAALSKTSGWESAPRLNTVIANATKGSSQSCQLKDLTNASGLTAPAIAKILGICPMSNNGSVQGGIWVHQTGERLALRGGGWYGGMYCGPAALDLYDARTYLHRFVGFRVAFIS